MENQNAQKSVKKAATASSLRVKPETRKRFLGELAKANKKSFGRKVRADQLLSLLLTLVRPEHLQQLQHGSLSNSDRLEMRYREHVKKFGPISKDEFLGLLLTEKSSKSESENAAVSEGKSERSAP
ncbi:MAG TPA: hypothetical protein PKC28_05975 [Bdellovibrionales bacterium]|nr:hypothetical protein [Bdellovibrionales bacterium]